MGTHIGITRCTEDDMRKFLHTITVVSLLLSSCGHDNKSESTDKIYSSVEDVNGSSVAVPTESIPEFPDLKSLEGKKAAFYTGSVEEQVLKKILPDNSGDQLNTYSDCFIAVSKGKADYTISTDILIDKVLGQYPDLTYQKEIVDSQSAYFGIAKTDFGEMLNADFTEYLNDLTKSGELEKTVKFWKDNVNESDLPLYDFTELNGSKGVINFAMEPIDAPFAHIIGSKWTGLEAQLVYDFAKKYDYSVEMSLIEFNSILTGISLGKIDITGYFSYTDERAESVLYSPPYISDNYVIIVRNIQEADKTADKNIFDFFAESFEKNFIREDRWKLMLGGLGVTLLISLLSGIIGTVLGVILCLIRQTKNKISRNASKVFIRIIQGIPVVVTLLVLYYIIFADSRMNAIIIGIIGFSVDFGVYVSEILRSGIEAIDKGQWEAAYALGLNKRYTYTRVILPQAINISLPVYKGQFISMVKMTSVVGYIAVHDLTKVSDIIRSRTYDALTPILITCVLYFILAWGLTALITRIELTTDPYKRKNVLKDIDKQKPITGEFKVDHAVSETEEVIRIEHLSKKYKIAAPLNDVNTVIRNKDIIAVIGPSGTGKSTLLRCINGLEAPTHGDIYFLDHKLDVKNKEVQGLRMKLGMVFQSFNLFNHLTVIENIMLAPVILKKIPRQEAYENGIRLLRQVGLADKAFAYPSELSGGQKQRAAIVRAVAMSPEVLLFDEPTSALDPTMINEVLHVISDLAKSGMTMLIVTHEMKFARDVSNRVFYMDQGGIYEDGPTEQIFNAPQKELTRAFINKIKLFHYKIESRYFDFLDFRTKFEVFGRTQMMNTRHINNVILCLEELNFNNSSNFDDDILPVEGQIEYTEDEKLEVSISYHGNEIDEYEHMDSISEKIFKSLSYDMSFSKEPDGTNIFKFFVKK